MSASEAAAAALANVDPARVRGAFAVGLRDGAALALLASGLSCAEAVRLRCDQVTIEARTGHVVITVVRRPWRCQTVLGLDCSAHLVAWLSEVRGYGERKPLLVNDQQRPLTRVALAAILARYLDRRAA